MTDYISREGIMKEFADFVRASNNSDFEPTPNWNDAVSLVGSYPAADVVEVVRCEKCKYYHSITARCEVRGKDLFLIRGSDDFCSRGERREDE